MFVCVALGGCAPSEPAEDVETSEAAQTSWGAACSTAVDMTPTIAAGGTFHGTLGAASSFAPSTCGNRTARATLLRYDLPSYGNYRVDVKSALPATDPRAKDAAVVVRSNCTSIIHEIACNDRPAEKSTYVGFHLSGPVYIRVEGAFFSQGFDVAVTRLPLECRRDADCSDWPDGKCNQLNGNCISKLACRGNLGNCDGRWDNGCETDLSTSAEHCGACNAECDTAGGHASAAACSAGVCKLTCDPGFADCDGRAKTGCEADLANEGLSCGACGVSCGGGVCRGGACATRGEEVTSVPVSSGSWSRRQLEKLALGDDHVFVSTGDYVGKLWAAPKSGGAPTNLADHGEAFDVANGAVVWATSRTVEQWSETTKTTKTLGSLPRPEWVQDLATNGVDVFLAYRDSDAIGVLRQGSTTVVPFWTDGRAARLAIGGSGLVVRGVQWSGYGYNAYSRRFTVLDDAANATTTADLASANGNYSFAADATDIYYGSRDGLWRLPIGGGAGTKLWDGETVFSVALEGSDVYFATCLPDRRAARGLRVKKTGGPAVEVVFDEIAAPEKGVYLCTSRPASRFLAADAQHIYWINGTTVRRVAK